MKIQTKCSKYPIKRKVDYRVAEWFNDTHAQLVEVVQSWMKKIMFDWKKPTVQMLGRWQPKHAGHTALFEKAH